MSVIDGGVVLITGASAGSGLEFAKQVASRAKGIVLVARRKEKLEQVAQELKSKNQNLDIFYRCDLSDDQIEKMVNSVLQKTHIDVLVNNAGLADFAFYDKSKWDREISNKPSQLRRFGAVDSQASAADGIQRKGRYHQHRIRSRRCYGPVCCHLQCNQEICGRFHRKSRARLGGDRGWCDPSVSRYRDDTPFCRHVAGPVATDGLGGNTC